jgi:hypothetical protein
MRDETILNITELHDLTPQQRLFVIRRAAGDSITKAAQAVGVTRPTASGWNGEPEIAGAILVVQATRYLDPVDAMEPLIPDAMQKLTAAVRRGEPWAIKEVLDRRYGKPVQRSEHSGPAGGPRTLSTPVVEMSDDELLAIASNGSAGDAGA